MVDGILERANKEIVLVRKLAIYCNYIWYILRTMDFYILGLRKRKKRYYHKAHCDPLQKSQRSSFN
jgi:hypothetical protein